MVISAKNVISFLRVDTFSMHYILIFNRLSKLIFAKKRFQYSIVTLTYFYFFYFDIFLFRVEFEYERHTL